MVLVALVIKKNKTDKKVAVKLKQKTKNLLHNSKKAVWKAYFLKLRFNKSNDQIAIKTMTEAALILALTYVFYWFAKSFSMAFWPQGGTVGFWMIPLILFAARHSFFNSCLLGIIYGVLLLLTSNNSFNPWDILLEYIFGFAPFAMPSFLRFLIKRKPDQQALWPYYLYFFLSVFIAGSLYFIISFVAGFLFFGQYNTSKNSVYVYSFIYNITYIGPSMLLSLAIFWVAIKQFRHIIYAE